MIRQGSSSEEQHDEGMGHWLVKGRLMMKMRNVLTGPRMVGM